jgi:hypothetical protein
MENNIIQTGQVTIIMNGGNPLEGCPQSYEEAYKWAEDANTEREEWRDPKWRFDCGFKLDFDGPLVRVSSRFYPPKTHYGPTWDGTVSIMVGDHDVIEKKFDCKTLDELHDSVEKYVSSVRLKLIELLEREGKNI